MDPSPSIAPLVSPWLSLCAVLLPSIGFTGVWLARRCLAHPSTRAVVALPLALTLWMLATQLIARGTQSFTIGVAAGSLLVALPGTFELARLARRAGELGVCIRAWLRRPRAEWLICLGGFAWLAVPIFRDQFHDEVSLSGQHSTIEQMLIGHYPPRLTFFPSEEYRYHLGFNILAALIAAIFRVSAPLAIDLLASLLLFSILSTMAHIGRIWLGRRRGHWVALFGFFAGGVTCFATPASDTIGARLAGYGAVHHRWLGPPISSYFFQHPFALGMALGLAAYAVHLGEARRDGLARFVVLGSLVIGLTTAHAAIAAVFGGAVIAAEVFDGQRFKRRGAIGAALIIAALAALRPLLGAWFAEATTDADGPSVLWSLGPVDEPLESLSWLGQTLGLLLPLGFLGLSVLRRGRFAALLVIAFGLGLGSLLKYAYSWDMVKFIATAQIMLGLTTGAFLLARRPRRSRAVRPWLAIAAFVALHAGLAFPLVTTLRLEGATKTGQRSLVSQDWQAAIEVLRARTGPQDLVYERPGRANMVNQFGLKVPHLGEVARKMGFVGPRAASRLRLLAELPTDADRWRDEGVTWFALEGDDPLASRAAAWLECGDAELVASFGDVRVLRLKR